MRIKYKIFLALFGIISCGCYYKAPIKDFDFNDPYVKITDTLSNVENEKAHVVFLFGQSNADGAAHNICLQNKQPELFAEYTEGYDNVMINFVNDGYHHSSNLAFQKCTIGCGYTKDNFGPEIGIAQVLHSKYPTEKSFIIKWTWGGTNLRRDWLDDDYRRGNLYNSSMDFSFKCLDYLSFKGYDLSIDGICWMQGESDTFISRANRYYRDTYAFVRLLRHDLNKYQENIKFIDAGINEERNVWTNAELINKGKKRFASESNLNYYIDTNEMGLTTKNEPEESPDVAHYDSASMVELGNAFGLAVTR